MGGAASPSNSEPPPAPVAGFVMPLFPREDPVEWTARVDGIDPLPPDLCVLLGWPVEIPAARGASRRCVALAAAPAADAGRGRQSAVWPRPSRVGAQIPRFAIAPETGFKNLCEEAAFLASDPAAEAPSLQPEPVTSLVAASAAFETAAGAPLNLPAFAMRANEDLDRLQEAAALRATGLAAAAPSPRPVPVACLVTASAALDAAATLWPPALPSFQGLTSIAALARRPRPAALMETGKRREHPSAAEQPRNGAVLLPFQPRERLPLFSANACFEPSGPLVEAVPRPSASHEWMKSAPPALTARMALPSIAATMPNRSLAPAMPSATQSYPPAVEPRLPLCASFQTLPQPEAVLVDAIPSMVAVTALSLRLRLPGMPAWQAMDSLRGAHVGPAEAPAPQPVETWPVMEPRTPAPALDLPPLSCPVPDLAAAAGSARLACGGEPDQRLRPAPVVPAAARMVSPTPVGARFHPQVSPGKPFAAALLGRPAVALAPAPFAALDFHCRPKPGVVASQVEWMEPAIAVIRPRAAVRPIFDRWEDLAPAPAAKSGLKKVAVMPRTMRQLADSKRTRHTIGVIAAGLLLGAAIWYSVGNGSGRNTREISSEVALNETPAAAATAPGRHEPSGPVSRLRHAIAERAAVSWSDSFRGGMEAWGAAKKSFAPGWTQSPDGYVQPGALAIFHPTLNYTDYTLEFFAQIERQSMDWVVRARDTRNYYAMKVTMVKPGMRPMVAMAHYSVVDGKKVGYMETPLDIMVHNSRPMQVLVDVRGNHFTASVDGQPVGSWTDDAPATGGVGFFAEAGEKARLYWMRVSRNQDLLGRLCAYVAGSPSVQTAWLWSQDPDGRPRRNGPDAPVEPAEALGMAAIVTLRRSRMRTRAIHAAPHFAERRMETWSP